MPALNESKLSLLPSNATVIRQSVKFSIKVQNYGGSDYVGLSLNVLCFLLFWILKQYQVQQDMTSSGLQKFCVINE